MQASIAFLAGVALALIILAATRPKAAPAEEPSSRPKALGWSVLVLGLIGLATFAFGALRSTGGPVYLTSIMCGYAALIAGIGALLRGERHWPTWVGLVASVVPALFWIVFLIGNIVSPAG